MRTPQLDTLKMPHLTTEKLYLLCADIKGQVLASIPEGVVILSASTFGQTNYKKHSSKLQRVQDRDYAP